MRERRFWGLLIFDSWWLIDRKTGTGSAGVRAYLSPDTDDYSVADSSGASWEAVQARTPALPAPVQNQQSAIKNHNQPRIRNLPNTYGHPKHRSIPRRNGRCVVQRRYSVCTIKD